jgi:hypothetical protein
MEENSLLSKHVVEGAIKLMDCGEDVMNELADVAREGDVSRFPRCVCDTIAYKIRAEDKLQCVRELRLEVVTCKCRVRFRLEKK